MVRGTWRVCAIKFFLFLYFLFTFFEVRFSVLFIIYHLSFAPIHRARTQSTRTLTETTWLEPRTCWSRREMCGKKPRTTNQCLRLPTNATKYYFHIYFVCIVSFDFINIIYIPRPRTSYTEHTWTRLDSVFIIKLQIFLCSSSPVCFTMHFDRSFALVGAIHMYVCEPQSVTVMQLQLYQCWAHIFHVSSAGHAYDVRYNLQRTF